MARWWPSAEEFPAIVSGERQDANAASWRLVLSLVEPPYTAAVTVRNWLYDSGRHPAQPVEVPVVSVGNLTLGGTGKTPAVLWLAQWFRNQHVRVSVISRGYRAIAGNVNDEALQLERRLPDVPHLENPLRYEAARLAIDELATQLILLDDGFQHRRLARDLDIVLIDALQPFGWNHVFPRGGLREPLAALRRADIVLLSRASLVEPEAKASIRQQVLHYAPEVMWGEVAQQPAMLVNDSQETQSLESLPGRRVAAFCGIGNPRGLEKTLESLKCDIVAFQEFPDHHLYQAADVAALERWAKDSAAEIVLTTEKDLVKLGVDSLGGIPLWALRIEMQFLSGQDRVEDKLRTILEKVPADESHPAFQGD